MPLLLKTASTSPSKTVRIINVSSTAHSSAPSKGLVLSDVKSDMSSYHTMTRYGHSKLANILFSRKLAELYPSITTVSLHPGFVNTEINSAKGGGAKFLSMFVKRIVPWFGLSVEEGAKTQLWCGVAPAAEVVSGRYYEPVGVVKAGSKWARDEGLKEELWEWTERELGVNGGVGWPEGK